MKHYSTIILSETSDYLFLSNISKRIQLKFNAKIILEVKGLDSVYLDFLIGNCKITLHQEHYLGISIFPTELDNATKEENQLIEKMRLELN